MINCFSVSKPIIRQGIPKEYDIAGRYAQNCLERMFDKLQSGEVSIKDLQKVSQHPMQMRQLYSAISSGRDGRYSYKSVDTAIKKRLEEYTVVKRHRKLIGHLFHLLYCDKVQGMSCIKKLQQY